VRILALTLLTAACSLGSQAPPAQESPSWQDFPPPQIQGTHTRYVDQQAFIVSETQRTRLAAACPVVRRGTAVKETDNFYLVTLEGERLQDARVGAVLPDKTLAEAQVHPIEGGIQIPVRCVECTLHPGIKLEDGRYAGCVGPGYSMTLKDGVLTSP